MSIKTRIKEVVESTKSPLERRLRTQARAIEQTMAEDAAIQRAIDKPGTKIIHAGREISSNGRAVVIGSATAKSIYPPGYRFPPRSLPQSERAAYFEAEIARLSAEDGASNA